MWRSASLPVLMYLPNPQSRLSAVRSIMPPMLPLCDAMLILPGRGKYEGMIAYRLDGLEHITPLQLGPATRMPPSDAASTSSSSSPFSSGPISPKPAAITSAVLTFPAHSRITCGAFAGGSTTSARSTGSGTSAIEGYTR